MKQIIFLCILLSVALADFAPLYEVDVKRVIPGSYIVALHDDVSLAQRDAHILEIKDLILDIKDGSKVTGSFNILTFIGYFAELSPKLLEFVRSRPEVKFVEQNQITSVDYKPAAPHVVVTQVGAPWGLQRLSTVDLPLTGNYLYNSTGAIDVDAYVIDTGIFITHVEFGGRAATVFNAINGEVAIDLNGHGTHVAGTIGGTTYGVAKNITLLSVKVLGANGRGTADGLIQGVNYVTNNRNKSKKAVANMSLSLGASVAVDNAVSASINSGVSYAVAAGNYNLDACGYSPARVSAAVTVGATTITDARADYSNFGACLSIFAPGSNILSAWIGNTTATHTISGTSMASPHACGVLALHLNDFGGTPAELKIWLTTTATPNRVTNPGAGSPNLLLYSPAA